MIQLNGHIFQMGWNHLYVPGSCEKCLGNDLLFSPTYEWDIYQGYNLLGLWLITHWSQMFDPTFQNGTSPSTRKDDEIARLLTLPPWNWHLGPRVAFFGYMEGELGAGFCWDIFVGKTDKTWVVVSNIFYFHSYLGKWSNLTNIFQMGWNHQPDKLGKTDRNQNNPGSSKGCWIDDKGCPYTIPLV